MNLNMKQLDRDIYDHTAPTHTVGDLGVCSGDLVDYSQNQGTQWDPVAHAQMKINIA